MFKNLLMSVSGLLLGSVVCYFFLLGFFPFCDSHFSAKKTVICQVGKDSKIRSFEVVGDTAILTIDGQYEKTAFALIDNFLSRELMNKDAIQRLNGTIAIPNELGYSSTLKIPVKGIKHPVILADRGWETLDTISPCQSIAFMIDSAGRIVPPPADKQ